MTSPTDSSLDFETLAGEPLALLASRLTGRGAFANDRVERLEFSCRGDRVPCTLVVPDGEGPFPLVLLQRESRGGERSAELEEARAFVEAGCALATVDLPLQGVRRSAKLSDLLESSIQRAALGEDVSDTASLLWCEFARQATLELRRTLDIVAALPTIDASRIGFAGFGLGALVGALLCGVDPRPAAVVLAGAGSGFGPSPVDPGEFVGRIAPTPLLLVSEEAADEGAPFAVRREAAEALHAAAAEPKEIVWTAGPDASLTAARAFLAPRLGV